MANWDTLQTRGEVDDRRGSVARVGSIGLGTVAIVALLNYALTGSINVQSISTQLEAIQNMQSPAGMTTANNEATGEYAGKDSYEVYASTVLGSTTDTWKRVFTQLGAQYQPPAFVLFRGATSSACGGAYAQSGPHYCPSDYTVYLDETFFDDLVATLGGSSGDVAQAYVIAHEVGHHVQTLMGIDSPSVAMELQADCFAGLWAHSIRDQAVFEPGEIQEAMAAAAAVGDDNVQKRTSGTIHPESWTHGSSKERMAAFTRGYETGTLNACK